MHRTVPFVVLVCLTLPALPATAQTTPPIDVHDLADYRLTPQVFAQFTDASQRIAAVTRSEPRFAFAPLFTREVTLLGDAPTMATGLMARLENDPDLAAALKAANVTSREYSKFALTLVAAHLAHEFMATGALARVPPGAPAQNVEFVKGRRDDVAAVLSTLGIEH